MSLEHEKFKQFLKVRRTDLPSVDKGKTDQLALWAIKRPKSQQDKESSCVVRPIKKKRPGRPSKPEEEKVRASEHEALFGYHSRTEGFALR